MAEYGQKHLDLLDKVGTDIQLISPRPFHAMHSLKPHKVVKEWNCYVNDVIAQTCGSSPRATSASAGLPQGPDEPLDTAVAELERCVNELGFVGCLINPDPAEGGFPTPPGLGDPYWYPLYEKLCEPDVPALVHSASCCAPRESYTLASSTRSRLRSSRCSSRRCSSASIAEARDLPRRRGHSVPDRPLRGVALAVAEPGALPRRDAESNTYEARHAHGQLRRGPLRRPPAAAPVACPRGLGRSAPSLARPAAQRDPRARAARRPHPPGLERPRRLSLHAGGADRVARAHGRPGHRVPDARAGRLRGGQRHGHRGGCRRRRAAVSRSAASTRTTTRWPRPSAA